MLQVPSADSGIDRAETARADYRLAIIDGRLDNDWEAGLESSPTRCLLHEAVHIRSIEKATGMRLVRCAVYDGDVIVAGCVGSTRGEGSRRFGRPMLIPYGGIWFARRNSTTNGSNEA